jgi:integrase
MVHCSLAVKIRISDGSSVRGGLTFSTCDDSCAAFLPCGHSKHESPRTEVSSTYSVLVFSDLDGTHRHPERFSHRFTGQLAQARTALGEEQLPGIRLHDLRHTHATLLLADGVPVKAVSERSGHASATMTLTVCQHVHPGMGRAAFDRRGGAMPNTPVLRIRTGRVTAGG